MSPMSSDPPPSVRRRLRMIARRRGRFGLRSSCSRVGRPRSGTFSSFCSALASVWSSSDHSGNPTFLMFSFIASRYRHVEMPGPCAAEHSRRVRRVRHHRCGLRHVIPDAPQVHDVLVVGLAEVIPDTRVRRHHVRLIAAVGDHVVRPRVSRRCSRRKFQPTSMSSTASSALLPRHGAPAAWALSPLKMYSTETMPV